MTKTCLLVYGSGGHNEQMRRIRDGFQSTEILFISLCDDDVKHPLTESYYTVPTVTEKFSYFKALVFLPFKLLVAISRLWQIRKKHRIDFILSTGPGLSIYSCIFFRLFSRAKIIHVETWSRFYTGSMTGRFMYYIAHEFVVQNQEQMKIYPHSIYKGRL